MRAGPSAGDLMRRPPAAQWRAAARPDWAALPAWLAEVARPEPVPPPWPLMIRAVLAIGVPLSAGFARAGAGASAAEPAGPQASPDALRPVAEVIGGRPVVLAGPRG